MAELKAMGPVVIAVLKQMRADQPPEAQQRIDHGSIASGKKTFEDRAVLEPDAQRQLSLR